MASPYSASTDSLVDVGMPIYFPRDPMVTASPLPEKILVKKYLIGVYLPGVMGLKYTGTRLQWLADHRLSFRDEAADGKEVIIDSSQALIITTEL